jgi:hypothetical protein
MKKIAQSWNMMKVTTGLIGRHPFLLAYLLAIGIGVGAVLGAMVAPVGVNLAGHGINAQFLEPYASVTMTAGRAANAGSVDKINPHWETLAPVFVGAYFLGTFIVVFFNVALLISARRLLNGQEATFSGGIAAAWERRGAIAQWSLFAATVGLVMQFIKNKMDNWLLKRIIGAGQLAWALATFLVIPVLAVEGGGPLQVLRRSTGLFKKTWGETLAAEVGIGTLGVILWFVVGLIPAAGMMWEGTNVISSNSGEMFFGAGFCWMVLSGLLIGILGEICSAVFKIVLYIYASEGVVPAEYKDDHSAWFVAQN